MYNVAAEYYIMYYYAIMEGWYLQKHTCIVQFKLKFTPCASKPANKLVQLYSFKWTCTKCWIIAPGETMKRWREKDKSSQCSRDSIQFRPTAAGFHKNAIFNLVSLCILKYARPYHCHLCYVTPRPTELMDPVMICNKNPSSSHSQLVLQTINRRSCTYNHGEGPY